MVNSSPTTTTTTNFKAQAFWHALTQLSFHLSLGHSTTVRGETTTIKYILALPFLPEREFMYKVEVISAAP
jgi:hypothetical protein